jgi:phage terminase small subunit
MCRNPTPLSPSRRPSPLKPGWIERDPTASAEWDRVVASGLATARDAETLAVHCYRCSIVVRLWAELDRLRNLFVEAEAGGLRPHPCLGGVNESERLLALHAARLGLPPARPGPKDRRPKPTE